jgi:hypothetical protein
MDTITAVVTALSMGALEGVKPTASQAVQDLYAGLKKLVQDRYHKANSSLEALEKKPESPAKRDSLQEDLQDAAASTDTELIAQAQNLLTAIEQHAPETAQAIGVKLEDVQAANIRLKEVMVRGEQAAGVHIKNATLAGDIEIGSVKVEAISTKK